METIRIPRGSKLGCLVAMRMQGFLPAVVIDVGAQIGTDALYQAFPGARHILIEPVVENRARLLDVASRLKDAEVLIAAVSNHTGETWLHVSENKRYSYTSNSQQTNEPVIEPRKVPSVRLDDLCRERALNGPFLVKIDVDGSELDVLNGMTGILGETECIVVETVFFGAGRNSFYRILNFMESQGFVVYDIVEPLYRPGDHALWQVDTIFVKRDGKFRKTHEYADAAGMKVVWTQ